MEETWQAVIQKSEGNGMLLEDVYVGSRRSIAMGEGGSTCVLSIRREASGVSSQYEYLTSKNEKGKGHEGAGSQGHSDGPIRVAQLFDYLIGHV